MGCSNENDLYSYVNNFNDSSFNTEEDFIKNRNISFSRVIYNVKSRQSCVDKCLNFYKFMAFKPRSSLCLCFKRLTRDFKEKFVHQKSQHPGPVLPPSGDGLPFAKPGSLNH